VRHSRQAPRSYIIMHDSVSDISDSCVNVFTYPQLHPSQEQGELQHPKKLLDNLSLKVRMWTVNYIGVETLLLLILSFS